MTEPIPFLDIQAQQRELREEILEAVRRVVESGQFILGPEVAAFEREFAEYCGAAHGVGVNSGTSALHLALLAAGVKPGDEVITVPYTFFATVAAIEYCRATPVFVDIDRRTFNMDPELIERAITPKTRAILPVHLYGQPADMRAINEIARKHDLVVIEDAAQAHGASLGDKRTGALSEIACFSFYPTKNLGAAGEGGMVVTNDPEYARTVRLLRDWGTEEKYKPIRRGFNYRLEAMQAAILRVKLRRLDKWTEARRAHAAMYDRLLAASRLTTPKALPGARHVYHIYSVQTPERDALQHALRQRGIATAVHYPLPIHMIPAYRDARYREGDFPVAEKCARQVLCLPMFPHLTAEQVRRVAEAVHFAMAGATA